jgi:lipopolysaccharide export LptBFGC system permease protein LptF
LWLSAEDKPTLPLSLAFYIFKGILKKTMAMAAILLLLYISIDIVETASRMENQTFFPGIYPFKLPQIISHIMPISVTAGLLLEISWLKATNQWTALQTAGIPPYKTLLPMMVVPTLFWAAGLLLVHHFAPLSYKRFDNPGRTWQSSGSAHTISGNYIAATDNNGITALFYRNKKGRTIYAEWTDEKSGKLIAGWTRQNGWINTSYKQKKKITFNWIPQKADNGIMAPYMTTKELSQSAIRLIKSGQSADAVKTEIEIRNCLAFASFAIPWLAFLIAAPLKEFRYTRLIPLGLSLCALYWTILTAIWQFSLFTGKFKNLFFIMILAVAAVSITALLKIFITNSKSRLRKLI